MKKTIRVLGTLALLLAASELWATGWNWKDVSLNQPAETKLNGSEGEMLNRGVARLALAPYDPQWVLADVSFAINRAFTNYSGDVSGRYIELAALTSPRGKMSPANFAEVLKHITDYQKADGHFGADIDLTKRITKKDPPMPMFWGNARLLAALVTAAQIYHDDRLLTSARKLGDYYIKSVELLCTPERIEELRATGSYGGSLTCCYFPAIEPLAMLHRATGEERYLKAARDIAEYFRHFDTLPTDHSHGSLCAYRGILMLYEITGNAEYLNRAEAKWDEAMRGGFVWPLGDVGEHWHVFYGSDEACSESDWLRFNLDLWHLTGRSRYLDLVNRMIINQYPANQCANGGFGTRKLDGEKDVGPTALKSIAELNFCCSFHGPLGLHFLKACLATGGKETIRVNLPLNFSAPVQAGGTKWLVTVSTTKDPDRLQWRTRIIAEPQDASEPVALVMWIPSWVTEVTAEGQPVAKREDGYIRLAANCTKKTEFTLVMQGSVVLEQRRFKTFKPVAGELAIARDVTLLAGPEVLMANNNRKDRLALLATADAAGHLELLRDAKGRLVSPVLPGPDAAEAQIHEALTNSPVVSLRPRAWSFWDEIKTRRRAAFVHDVVIVPGERLKAEERSRFARRAADAADAPCSPIYGEGLENRPEIWLDPGNGWRFQSSGLLALYGIGLLDGEGYSDYRFEFDMTLAKEGQGLASWVVRAKDESDYLMFQIQSSDTSYKANQWKPEPNTLRPQVRRGGKWTALESIKIKKDIFKEKTCHVATECRREQVTVWIDGEKVYSGNDGGLREGSVGFRSGSSAEQCLYRNISLKSIGRPRP